MCSYLAKQYLAVPYADILYSQTNLVQGSFRLTIIHYTLSGFLAHRKQNSMQLDLAAKVN